MKSTVEDEFDFPIGSPLIEMSLLEDRVFGGDELCLDEVQLIFTSTKIILQPIADTDEIDIILKSETYRRTPFLPKVMALELGSREDGEDDPNWYNSFIGKKLQTVWVCENSQGYRDQIIFAFEYLHPNISFVAEGSVLKVFQCQQIHRGTKAMIEILDSELATNPKSKI